MSNNNNSSSKWLNVIIYIFVVLLVLGFAISAIYSITNDYTSDSSDGTTDGTETQYAITWGGGTIPDGYSFEYNCPDSAAASETVTISIYDTVTTTTGTAHIYFTVKSTDDGTQYISSGSKPFQTNTYSFTMPEYDVTVTYVVTEPSGSLV